MANEKISEYLVAETTPVDTDRLDISIDIGGTPETRYMEWGVLRSAVDNIYNIDNTLLGNRAVDMDSNNLTFSNGGLFSVDSAAVFNDGGTDQNFRIEGLSETNLFFTDAGNDRIGIRTNTPSELLEMQNDVTRRVRFRSFGTNNGMGMQFGRPLAGGGYAGDTNSVYMIDGGGTLAMAYSSRSDHIWQIGGSSTEAMRLSEIGEKLGLGIVATHKFQVFDDALNNTHSTGYFENTNTTVGFDYTALTGLVTGIRVTGENIAANLTASGATIDNHALILADGDFAFRDKSPAQITGDQNDFDTNGASSLRLDTDALRNITGFNHVSNGKILVIHNIGSFDLVIQHQNAGSAAANRVITGNAGTDLTLNPDDSAVFKYDSTSSRWRLTPSI